MARNDEFRIELRDQVRRVSAIAWCRRRHCSERNAAVLHDVAGDLLVLLFVFAGAVLSDDDRVGMVLECLEPVIVIRMVAAEYVVADRLVGDFADSLH